ncbi:hypothetical protein Tco_0625874 [Tanacetum coccineum]|uniref:Uncharacterized protein n=1 Tax=Tanacetum coccineum TaxID=301880 RepID=A0ABQ4WI41_9ASTR
MPTRTTWSRPVTATPPPITFTTPPPVTDLHHHLGITMCPYYRPMIDEGLESTVRSAPITELHECHPYLHGYRRMWSIETSGLKDGNRIPHKTGVVEPKEADKIERMSVGMLQTQFTQVLWHSKPKTMQEAIEWQLADGKDGFNTLAVADRKTRGRWTYWPPVEDQESGNGSGVARLIAVESTGKNPDNNVITVKENETIEEKQCRGTSVLKFPRRISRGLARPSTYTAKLQNFISILVPEWALHLLTGTLSIGPSEMKELAA